LKCRKHSRLGFGVVQKHNSAVIVAPVLALSFLASMIGGGAILGGIWLGYRGHPVYLLKNSATGVAEAIREHGFGVCTNVRLAAQWEASFFST
jgi:hypothetical protein